MVGGQGAGRSPRLLQTTTVGDELKIATAGRSKVVTVSAKDRAAIMLGGHRADAAYWIVDTLFVTSSWYRSDLPGWVQAVNRSRSDQPILRHPMGSVAAGRPPTRGWDRTTSPAEAEVEGRRPDLSPSDRGSRRVRAQPHGWTRRWPNSRCGRCGKKAWAATAFPTSWRSASAPPTGSDICMAPTATRSWTRWSGWTGRWRGCSRFSTAGRPGRTLIVLTADHGVAPLPEKVAEGRPDGPRRLDPAVLDSAVSLALTGRYGGAPAPRVGELRRRAAPVL